MLSAALGVGLLALCHTVSLFVLAGHRRSRLYFKSIVARGMVLLLLVSGVICLSLIIYSTMRDTTSRQPAMHRHE
jgi:MHS family alpha-ketoglutarate permease-like MFS transporter